MDWFNRKYYYLKTIFLYFVVIALMMMYKTPMYNLFDNYILPILTITEYDWLLLTFIILALFIALYIIIKAIKGYQLSFFRIVTYISLLIIYGYFRYLACTTNIYIFRPSNDEIGYIDIIFLVLAISLALPAVNVLKLIWKLLVKASYWFMKLIKISPWVATVRKFIWKQLVEVFYWFIKLIKKPGNKQERDYYNLLLPDIPLTDPKEDLLGYNEFSKNIAKKIDGVSKDAACSLGIIAEWGVGKSTVINFIKHYLDKKRYIIIRFNPRHSFTPNRIQEDFYSFLSSELKEYNSVFSTIFVDYMKGAGIIGKNNTIQILLNSYKVWNKEGESARINNAIKNLNKRVVVIIEDLDRLLAEEIIEVFKIIDNNSISNNIIFISAYDKEYINKILDEKYKHQDSMFSDKFFSWEVNLPVVSHTKITNFLNNNLNEILRQDFIQYPYSNIISNNTHIIKNYIKTIRDAKRFINYFIDVYAQKKGKVNFEDFLLLSLIKYRYPSEYNDIFNLKLVEIRLDSPLKYSVIDSIDDEIKSKEIIQKLFFTEREKSYNLINSKYAFLGYFLNESDHIQLNEIQSLYENESLDSSFELLRFWHKKNRIRDVFEYFYELNIFTLASSEQVYRYIDCLLFLSIVLKEDVREFIRIFFLEADCSEICKKFQIGSDQFKTIILAKLKGEIGKYPYSITRECIINIIDYGEKGYIFTKKEIQEITKHHINNYIDNKKDIAENLEIELLYENIDNIEPTSRVITLNPEVCDKVKEYIKGNPDFYIKQFVRNGVSSSSKYFFMLACEPFWEKIFGDKDQFNAFINTPELDQKENIQLVRNFWKLYEAHNYKPIEFENQGITYEEAISDQLLSLSSDAIRIKEIGDIAKEINGSERSAAQKIKDLERLSIELKKMNLYIRKKGEVSETITRYLKIHKIKSRE